jgi:hypothetical protein
MQNPLPKHMNLEPDEVWVRLVIVENEGEHEGVIPELGVAAPRALEAPFWTGAPPQDARLGGDIHL